MVFFFYNLLGVPYLSNITCNPAQIIDWEFPIHLHKKLTLPPIIDWVFPIHLHQVFHATTKY